MGSNSLCACSPVTPSNNTRPLGNKLLIRKVRSEASRPGMSSARKTTFIPGRAHISATFDFSRRRWRRQPVLFLITTAPIAPSAQAVKAIPPNTRLLAFFISRSQISDLISQVSDLRSQISDIISKQNASAAKQPKQQGSDLSSACSVASHVPLQH